MTDIESLSEQWLAAKDREAIAREQRIEIEGFLIEALGCKPEGAQTHKVGALSVTIEGRMSYTCSDIDRLATLAPELTKRTLHDTAVRRLRESDPARYTSLARLDLIGVKPMKPGVSIKVRDDA